MSLDSLRDKIAKKAKGVHVSILSQSEIATSTENIPTPAYDLNRILSGSLFKGIPSRTLSLFVGPEASGKSSFMCLCLAKAQKEGYSIVVLDTEGAWNENFVTRWGLDPKEMLYIYTPWVDKVCVSLGQIIDSGDTKIALVIDSVGAMEIFKLVEDSVSGDVKADQGRLQKDQKRMLKMLQNIAKNQNSIVMCAGHYYGSPSTYGSAEEVGGGKYMKLGPDIIVSLKKSKLFENGDKKKIIGNAVKAITLKNRYYPPFQEAIVEIDYRKGINSYAGILDLAIEAGLASVGGSWFTIDDEKFQGATNATEGLRNDKTILNKLDEWLKQTGYSTINENIVEATKILEKEIVDDIEEEIDKNDKLNYLDEQKSRKITSKIIKKK